MMPHGRLVGAAVIYSLVLALVVAGLAVASLLFFMTWSTLDGSPDNGPIRGAGALLLIGPPASFFVSLFVTVPITYLIWRRRPIARTSLAKLVGVSAAASGLPFAYVGMGLTFSPYRQFAITYASFAAMIAIVLAIPSVAWWFAAPRELTGRSCGV
jgi:hypothetical protein